MKKLLLILLCLPFIGFGQDCKFLKNEIDDMTQERTLITKGVLLCNVLFGSSLLIQPILTNGNFSIVCSFSRYGEFNISEGNRMIIKVYNELIDKDELVTLTIKNSTTKLGIKSELSETTDSYGSRFSAYAISERDWDILTKNKIKKIRIYFDDGAVNLTESMGWYWEKEDFKQRKIDKLFQQFNCLSNELLKQ